MEQALCILVATLAASNEAEVCDHLPLELLVSQLPKEIERLLEVLNCNGDAAARVNEREGEVVQRQRLGAPVTLVAHDRERGAVLDDRPFVISLTSKLRAELVETMRSAAAIVCDRFPLLTVQEVMGPPRNPVRGIVKALTEAELVEPGFSSPGGSLDRGRACPRCSLDRGRTRSKCAFDSVAALKPDSAGHNAAEEQEREGGKQKDAESESRQEPGQEEPNPGECEDATTELLAIDRPLE
jgi:hypothetical protein